MSAPLASEWAKAIGDAEPGAAPSSPMILALDQIKSALPGVDIVERMEEGFIAYSRGEVVVPGVGELLFQEPPGDAHIKYGYIKGDDFFVIKVATGFYENAELGLPTSSGLMLLFSQRTGDLLCVMLDEGYLTNVRTAAAGAVAAKYLAPATVNRIGVLGTGVQARLQLRFLSKVVDCIDVTVWGRSEEHLKSYKDDLASSGYIVQTTRDINRLADECNLIITTTPANAPLLMSEHIRPGTHITAVGSDTSEKNELDSDILGKADIVVADSLSQCRERGEIHHAVKANKLDTELVRELGNVIASNTLQRQSQQQITVADLTGVAVQDIQIAKAVYHMLADAQGPYEYR